MSDMLIRFHTRSLFGASRLRLLMPDDAPFYPYITENNPYYNRPAKTLVILHGFSGDECTWLYQGRAQELCLRYNLNIVLANGNISFYLNRVESGQNYCTFIGEDLMAFLRKTFSIAERREDTLIAGESMGGFGALHTGFAYPDTFGHIIALSSGLIQHEVSEMKPEGGGNFAANYEYYRTVFGEPEKLLESDNNPETLVKKMKAAGKQAPKVFMACGTEDFLLPTNIEFRDFLEREGIPVDFHIGEGEKHDFAFWNRMMDLALPWALA